jgi:S-methylmethionine-dependent homocysteine/selenocysteine methylase
LRRLLAAHVPVILDGAMGTELDRRGVDIGLPLWSANALLAAPEVVLAVHRDYCAAGADIITTNTFRTTRRAFRNAGLPDRSAELTAMAVDCAREARNGFAGRPILVAGSMAPLEDCYRPDLVPPDADLEREHAVHARRLADAGVDLLLIETMISVREAAAACRAAAATGLETIVSFTCRTDGCLYGGEPLEEAVAAVVPNGPAALSLNCISPHILGPVLRHLRELTRLPLAAYANVGTPEGEHTGRTLIVDVSPDAYTDFAAEWTHGGCAIIGGCCGTTPEHIARLRGFTTETPNHQERP